MNSISHLKHSHITNVYFDNEESNMAAEIEINNSTVYYHLVVHIVAILVEITFNPLRRTLGRDTGLCELGMDSVDCFS